MRKRRDSGSVMSPIGAVYVLLASLVLLGPQYEVTIWWWVSVALFLPAIAIAMLFGRPVEKLVALMSLVFVLLLPYGLPGTLLGWSGSLLIGLQSGRSWMREMCNGKYGAVFIALAITPLFAVKLIYDIYTVGISHELQSNFFAAASINYANAQLLGSASLVATCLIGENLIRSRTAPNSSAFVARGRSVRKLSLFLLPLPIFFVLAMDYRAGILAVLGLIFFLGSRTSKRVGWLYLAAITYVFIASINSIIGFLVPGRDSVMAVFSELADEDNRIERAIAFGSRVLLDKTGYGRWSEGFSVSALSDLLAVTFPVSLLLLAYFTSYGKNAFRVGMASMREDQRIAFLLLVLSGFAIALLQPDFFNLFVLGFQAGMINSIARLPQVARPQRQWLNGT